MQRKAVNRGLALVTVLLLMTGLAAGHAEQNMATRPMNHGGVKGMNHSAHNMQMQMDDMVTPLKPLKGKAFDIKWTQLMIDHHQMAVDMARHELDMGKNALVKAEAQKVVNAQTGEIAMMRGWLKAWTGKDHAPRSMPMDMSMPGGADRWFLEGMIPHHQGAIDMSELITDRTQNVDVRKLGANIIRAQTAEIAQYRQMLSTVK